MRTAPRHYKPGLVGSFAVSTSTPVVKTAVDDKLKHITRTTWTIPEEVPVYSTAADILSISQQSGQPAFQSPIHKSTSLTPFSGQAELGLSQQGRGLANVETSCSNRSTFSLPQLHEVYSGTGIGVTPRCQPITGQMSAPVRTPLQDISSQQQIQSINKFPNPVTLPKQRVLIPHTPSFEVPQQPPVGSIPLGNYPFTPVMDTGSYYFNKICQMRPPPTANGITVNGKTYSMLSLIGRGGSSKVYQVYEVEKKKLLAVKCVSLENADEYSSTAYKNEINLLEKLQHSDRVIKLYDYEYNEEKNCLYAVMEKGDTDLASLIQNYAKSGQITPEMIKFYWSEMLRTVEVIHAAGIIHSDLKPGNFLLVSGKLKLIDFGIASSLQTDMTSVFKDTQVGTFNYMSPEAIQDIGQVPESGDGGKRPPRIKIGVKSDVWSLGCILYNLVYGRTPFQHIRQPLVKMQAITNPNHEIELSDIPDKQLLDVMKQCLIRNPKARPSISELLQHKYLMSEAQQVPEVNTVLKQLAALTPRSIIRVSREFTKLMDQARHHESF